MLLLVTLPLSGWTKNPPGQDTIVYLFPGQGSDARLFKHLELPPGYDTVNMVYPIPEKRESMHSFALRFIDEIDQSSPYILMGVSLGGMICTELTDTLAPVKTIIISSAKAFHELPNRYTFVQKVPVNRIIPKRITKGSARILQGIVEPDRKYDKETFKDMLKIKDPLYVQRTVDMITHWERTNYSSGIIHIHGNMDHTIPIKNVQYDYLVEEGSHMMMITRADEINRIIAEIIHE
ncbi:MAG: alpha/beta hydrolase [Bacteroidota bacterium]